MLADFVMRVPEDPGDQQLLDDVRKFGWHQLHISAEADLPEYTFTVGLYYSWQFPEIVVLGLPPQVASSILWGMVRHISGGGTYPVGKPMADILESVPVALINVGIEHYEEYLGYANWFYRCLKPRTYPVLQLVWPDGKSRFPWTHGFDTDLRRRQPLLGAAPTTE